MLLSAMIWRKTIGMLVFSSSNHSVTNSISSSIWQCSFSRKFIGSIALWCHDIATSCLLSIGWVKRASRTFVLSHELKNRLKKHVFSPNVSFRITMSKYLNFLDRDVAPMRERWWPCCPTWSKGKMKIFSWDFVIMKYSRRVVETYSSVHWEQKLKEHQAFLPVLIREFSSDDILKSYVYAFVNPLKSDRDNSCNVIGNTARLNPGITSIFGHTFLTRSEAPPCLSLKRSRISSTRIERGFRNHDRAFAACHESVHFDCSSRGRALSHFRKEPRNGSVLDHNAVGLTSILELCEERSLAVLPCCLGGRECFSISESQYFFDGDWWHRGVSSRYPPRLAVVRFEREFVLLVGVRVNYSVQSNESGVERYVVWEMYRSMMRFYNNIDCDLLRIIFRLCRIGVAHVDFTDFFVHAAAFDLNIVQSQVVSFQVFFKLFHRCRPNDSGCNQFIMIAPW